MCSFLQINKSLLKSVAKGVIFFALSCFVLSLVFAFAAMKTDDPTSYAKVFSYVCAGLSALFAGLFAAKKNKGRGLLCGLFTGLSASLLMLISFLLFSGEGGPDLIPLALTVVFSALGGCFFKKNVRRKRRTPR